MNLPEGWFFRFNNGVTYFTKDAEEAANIRKHLAANEHEEEFFAAAPTPSAQEELADTYVQPVPDKCDRITWRGRYYSLPISTPPAQEKEYSCPCGIGDEPCPDENGKPLCDDTPAQEDEPVYFVMDGYSNGWLRESKHVYDKTPAEDRWLLYLRPADDKLRKAAAEASDLIAELMPDFEVNARIAAGKVYKQLRAALEGK